MSKEKQIEEMARMICRDYNGGICATDGFVCNYNCEWTQIAKHLYNAGYRKQSEGEWKILKMGDGEKVRTCSACKISQTVNVYKGKVMFMFCPYCGAKMKGAE